MTALEELCRRYEALANKSCDPIREAAPEIIADARAERAELVEALRDVQDFGRAVEAGSSFDRAKAIQERIDAILAKHA